MPPVGRYPHRGHPDGDGGLHVELVPNGHPFHRGVEALPSERGDLRPTEPGVEHERATARPGSSPRERAARASLALSSSSRGAASAAGFGWDTDGSARSVDALGHRPEVSERRPHQLARAPGRGTGGGGSSARTRSGTAGDPSPFVDPVRIGAEKRAISFLDTSATLHRSGSSLPAGAPGRPASRNRGPDGSG